MPLGSVGKFQSNRDRTSNRASISSEVEIPVRTNADSLEKYET